MIRNCPINSEYSIRSDYIYGPSPPIIQGGMEHQRKPSERVPRVPLPTDISLHHKNIELYCIFFI